MDGRRRTSAFANGAHSARFSRSAYMISSYHSRLLPAARRRYAKERSRANRCSRGEGRSFYVLPLFLWQRPALARAGPPARLATSSVAERHMCVRHINQDRWCRWRRRRCQCDALRPYILHRRRAHMLSLLSQIARSTNGALYNLFHLFSLGTIEQYIVGIACINEIISST